MLQKLVKTQPDWHEPLNKNADIIEDKLTLKAVCTYDSAGSVYNLVFQNIPEEIEIQLPQGLPDLFSVVTRLPNDFVAGAAFRIGGALFTPQNAAFKARDVLTINFDRPEQACFFASGGASIIPAAFTIPAASWQPSAAYPGYDYEATLPVPGLTPDDLIRADFDLTSLIDAEGAEIAAAGDTAEGSAVFYAKAQPESGLSGMYTVYKAVV